MNFLRLPSWFSGEKVESPLYSTWCNKALQKGSALIGSRLQFTVTPPVSVCVSSKDTKATEEAIRLI